MKPRTTTSYRRDGTFRFSGYYVIYIYMHLSLHVVFVVSIHWISGSCFNCICNLSSLSLSLSSLLSLSLSPRVSYMDLNLWKQISSGDSEDVDWSDEDEMCSLVSPVAYHVPVITPPTCEVKLCSDFFSILKMKL